MPRDSWRSSRLFGILAGRALRCFSSMAEWEVMGQFEYDAALRGHGVNCRFYREKERS